MTLCGYWWHFRMCCIVITGVKMRHSVRDLPVVSAEPVDLQKHSLVQGKAVYFLVKVHGRSCDSLWISDLKQTTSIFWYDYSYFYNNFASTTCTRLKNVNVVIGRVISHLMCLSKLCVWFWTGCLMIIAWVCLASIGIVAVRYYKTVWLEETCMRERIWYQVSYSQQNKMSHLLYYT